MKYSHNQRPSLSRTSHFIAIIQSSTGAIANNIMIEVVLSICSVEGDQWQIYRNLMITDVYCQYLLTEATYL